MSVIHEQSCPICSTTSNFEPVGFCRKHFRCVACGEFVVTELAEAWLRQTPLQHRDAMRKRIIEAEDDQLLVISRDSLVGGGAQTYTAELVPRAEAIDGKGGAV
jgi:hypothetical protein